MRFSEYFEIRPNNQRDLEFVDIRIDTDNYLFIDPTIMAISQNERDIAWHEKVQSFVETALGFYRDENIPEARAIFNSSNESNEIFLGYSIGSPRGNGNSENSLDEVFTYVNNQRLIMEGLIERVEDLGLFVPKFGPDSLSDLVASLLKKELIEFTIEQCEIHGIDRTVELRKPFWNHEERNWGTVTEMLPANEDGRPIVLIPKGIVTRSYAYDPRNYLSDVVLVRRQQHHRANETELHSRRYRDEGVVSKKLIYEAEVSEEGLTRKEYLINMTLEDTTMIDAFRDNVRNTQLGTNGGRMTDEELEEYINESYGTEE